MMKNIYVVTFTVGQYCETSYLAKAFSSLEDAKTFVDKGNKQAEKASFVYDEHDRLMRIWTEKNPYPSDDQNIEALSSWEDQFEIESERVAKLIELDKLHSLHDTKFFLTEVPLDSYDETYNACLPLLT